MEQEKREYKKNREREKEKEKERERERTAMERMAMERKRQEAEHRVIFRNDYGTFLPPHHFISSFITLDKVSLKEEWFFCSVPQPHSDDAVRPRTRDEYEQQQRQRNHNKPARYGNSCEMSWASETLSLSNVFLPWTQASSASATRLWEHQRWLRLPGPPCAPSGSNQAWCC